MRRHDDFIGSQAYESTARHCVMRHKDSHLSVMVAESPRDLKRGKHQAAGSMDNQVDRHSSIGQADGAENLLGVVDIDVANDRKSKQAHGLLTMNHYDHT